MGVGVGVGVGWVGGWVGVGVGVCGCVCVCACVRVCGCGWVGVGVGVGVGVCGCVCVCACVRVCGCGCVWVWVCVCLCLLFVQKRLYNTNHILFTLGTGTRGETGQSNQPHYIPQVPLNWQEITGHPDNPPAPLVFTELSGPTTSLPPTAEPIRFFEKLVDSTVMGLVDETNRYALDCMQKDNNTSLTTVDNIYKYYNRCAIYH